jgi:surfactin synthase thioesterase subunit
MEILSKKRWLVGTKLRDVPLTRLYCFPHGGGSVAEYVQWGPRMPRVEVMSVQLPGRGSRINEPPFRGMDELTEAIVHEVGFQSPFAFFGHCMGALVAYEVTRTLRRQGLPLPEQLFVSGFRAPHLPSGQLPIHDLPDDEFLAEVDRRQGLPDEVIQDADLRAVTLPGLRADYELLETYRYLPEPPLHLPVTAQAGTDDDVDDLAAWQLHTTAPLVVRRFPGGHFYHRGQRDRVLRTLSATLRASARAEQG